MTVEPNVIFGPGVTVEKGVRIRAFSHLEGCHVGAGAVIGPFARLRPGTELADGTHVGISVEIKNATLGNGAKANHLSYIGDASVGAAATSAPARSPAITMASTSNALKSANARSSVLTQCWWRLCALATTP